MVLCLPPAWERSTPLTNRTVTIGNPTTHSPDDARTEANRIKAAAGADPAAEKKTRAAGEQRKRRSTLQRLLKDYEVVLPRRTKMRGVGLPTARCVADEMAQPRQALADVGVNDTPAANLTEADMRRVLSATVDRTATARARFGAPPRFLDWWQDAGHIQVNPCSLVSRARRPRPRKPGRTTLPRRNLPACGRLLMACTSQSGATSCDS
jgi:hypothetical protein